LIEHLETRRLLAVINVVSHYGARPNDGADDGPAIQRAINAAADGDTIFFPAGQFDISGTLTLRGGARGDKIYQGENGSILQFRVGARQYGMTVFKDSSNILVQGLKLVGGGIALAHGSGYNNVRVLNNDISALPAATRGVYAPVKNTGLIVENNVFHDYNEWGVMIYHMDRGSFSNNRFHNITQGAQIVNPYNDVRVIGNGGCRLSRMGIEIQQFTANGVPCHNLLVEGNVFTSWRSPFWDSFGLSIMPQNGYNVVIRNNYMVAAAPASGQWGIPDSSGAHRYGYGIEAGFRTGVVENNVVGGIWANHVVVSMPNTPVQNNQFYGRPVWGRYVTGEPGMFGNGWAIESGNTIDTNMGNMPAHSMPDVCTGLPPGSPPPTPTPTPAPPPNPSGINAPGPLKATPFSSSRVDLTWTDNSNNELGFQIERSFIGASGPFTQVGLVGANVAKWSNFGLPANRTIWYRVRAYGTTGRSPYSNVVQVKTPTLGGTGGSLGMNSSSILPTTSPTKLDPVFSDLLI
jgi:hypothetical protein